MKETYKYEMPYQDEVIDIEFIAEGECVNEGFHHDWGGGGYEDAWFFELSEVTWHYTGELPTDEEGFVAHVDKYIKENFEELETYFNN